MRGFFPTGNGTVTPDWVDINQHMNVSHYMVLFDRGTFALLEKLGIDQQSVNAGRPTVFASRVCIAHRKELLLGEVWQLWSGFVSVAASSLTITHRLASGCATRATCDIKGEVISPVTRAKDGLTDEQRREAEKYRISGLRDRFSVG